MPTRLHCLLARTLPWFACWLLAGGGPALAADDRSPAKAAAEAIDSRLTGKTAGEPTYRIWYNIADYNTGTNFSWNQQDWCADWIPYLTCFSPWNSNEHGYQAGTLITPKHVLFAEHFSGKSGSNTLHAKEVIQFIGKSGTPYRRSLLGTPVKVGNSDLCVGTLDKDLPPDVLPAQVLPPGLPPDFLPPGTPVIFTNKNKEARVAEVASFGQQAIMPARDPLRAPWTLPGPAAVGDSGCPVFVVLNGRPVLWWLFHYPNAGESISANISVINKMLGKGYQLDVAKVANH